MVATRDGHFDASDTVLSVVDAETKPTYHRPALVQLALTGIPVDKLDDLPPNYARPNAYFRTTSIDKTHATIVLDGQVTGDSATIQTVSLDRLERPLEPHLANPVSAEKLGSASVSTQMEIPFPPGKNEMTLRAVVSDSYGVDSKPAVLIVERPEHEEELAGRLFVLAVGVSKYKYPEYTLKYPATDAEAIASALKKQEGLTFSEVHTQVYVNEQATIENVKSGLNWLKRVATADDVAVVFFSGHGLQARRGLYYLTHEGDGEAIQYTCLNWDEVAKALQETKARQTLFLSDACHAGAFAKTQLAMQAELAKSLQEIDRVLVFASSEGEEVSLEHDDWGHGAFTKALLEGLAGHADADQDGAVSVAELIESTTRRVVSLTNRNQHPYLPKPEGYDKQLILVRTRPAEAKRSSEPAAASPIPADPAPTSVGVLAEAADIKSSTTILGRAAAGARFPIDRRQGDWIPGTFDIRGQTIRGWVPAKSVQRDSPPSAPVIAP